MQKVHFGFFVFEQQEAFAAFDRIGPYYCNQMEDYHKLWFKLRVDGKTFDSRDCRCASLKVSGRKLTAEFTVTENFSIRSEWTLENENLISRRETFCNNSPVCCRVEQFAPLFPLTHGTYEAFIQRGIWCGEHQGEWEKLRSGTRELAPVSGRYTENSTPFTVIRDAYAPRALAFHLIPDGNWQIRLNSVIRGGVLPALHVEMGAKTEHLACTVAPGKTLTAPMVCIQNLPNRSETGGAAAWHRFVLKNIARPPKTTPMLYNCWLDHYNFLDVERLRRQLAVAKAVGCEYFVVDYGWFIDHDYFLRIGEWTEKTGAAFDGKMAEFADEVRANGMKFGLWVESEFFHESTPEITEHPEWFERTHGSTFRLRLENPAAAEFFRSTLEDVIRRYRPEYIKNDMNHTQEMDSSGTELMEYTRAFQNLMQEFRTNHPEIFWESCASGAMRQTEESLKSFDMLFISDNADPVDNLYLLQGAMFRLPPGRILRWLVLSGAENATECRRFCDNKQILIPQYATWDNFAAYDFDFAVLAAMNGSCFGISGDLSSMDQEGISRLKTYVDFQKQYRDSIARCAGYFLTPTEKNEKYNTWAAFEYCDRQDDRHFVYAFHNIRFGEPAQAFPLHELDAEAMYRVRKVFPVSEAEEFTYSGRELMTDGLYTAFRLHGQGGWRGQLWVIEK